MVIEDELKRLGALECILMMREGAPRAEAAAAAAAATSTSPPKLHTESPQNPGRMQDQWTKLKFQIKPVSCDLSGSVTVC